MSKAIFTAFTVCIILITFSALVNAADDEYKPYLHKATVPEHPKLSLYGEYKTNLFPGAATYSYSIDVPKGTNDLTPSLSVSYNSQTVKQRPSILGAGWLLTQNFVYRDINSTLNDTSDDSFKLVLAGVQYELVNSSEWHTKIESYMKIENLSTAFNSYGMYWKVVLKDGTSYRFGYDTDSELTSDSGYALKWSLDLVTDVYNNKIYYSYLEDPFSEDFGTVYLDKISYNNYEEREIEFVYESSLRPDNRIVYEQGNKFFESRRLQDINVLVNGNLVRRYGFEYVDLNSEGSLSSLSSLSLYGSDNVSSLYNVSFEYYPGATGYSKSNGVYIPEELFSNYQHKDFGVRLIDFNNDGFMDIVKGNGANSLKNTFINNRADNWTEIGYFSVPEYISVEFSGSEVDNGVRFADLNGDGFVDILYGQGPNSIKRAYLNNCSGWNESKVWASPVYFVEGDYIDSGARLIDFNGDGFVDILQGKTGGNSGAYMNTGSGWIDVGSSWKTPVDFIYETLDNGARIVDLNGDGLPDIIQGEGASSVKKAWINNGTGWFNYTNYDPPVYFTAASRKDNGARFTDVNGDGLIDILVDFKNETNSNKSAYINNGDGWTSSIEWKSSESFTKDGYNIGRRLGDVNGDGYADIIIAYGNATTSELDSYIKNHSTSYLLKRIVNEYGGVISIDYSKSTSYNNSAFGNSTLGFNIWVVGNVTQNNSLSNHNSIGNYSYSYFGGMYDYFDKEFRGFSLVNETKLGSVVSHYFHQSDALKGKEYRTLVHNSSNVLFSKTENNYSYVDKGYYEVFLDFTVNYLYDGFSTAEITNVTYAYDSYGNIVYKENKGDVFVIGDEKYEVYSYVYNSSSNIVDKVSRYRLYSDDNLTLAKETRYYYDSLDWGSAPVKGSLTKVEEWNSDGADAITNFEYDSYGNVIKKIDGLGHVAKYLYGLRDTTYTYVDRITNALGHMTDYSYDLGTGNLLWEEKNNVRKSYYYDTFGRVIKEVLPYDSYDVPTKEYVYNFTGSAPEVIKVSLREHGNDYVDTYYFYDGFANLVQLKSKIENNGAITKNIFYDGLGRVKEEQNPYKETFSSAISTPSSTVNKTFYTYDALDRVIKVINPDNTNKKIIFNKYSITDYDENDNKHDYQLDAHGRIVNVIEYNNDPYSGDLDSYNTSYEYDTNDNLIKITDNEGNEFEFTYDSLGRKTKLDDPDLGTWKYSYDAVGNLKEQNDSVGNVITMSYDSLNRVLNKNSTDVNISFVYDGQYYGTLSNITMGGVIFRYTYDERMRVAKEEVLLGGSWIETGISYDSMDRIAEKRLPSTDLEYLYNKQGKVSNITGFIGSAHYNAFGSITNRTYNNNLVTRFTYNASNNRLTNIQTGALQNLAYSYDAIGNILTITDSVQSKNYAMGYDKLDRLINTTINNDLYQYEYDSIGNIKRIVRAGSAKRLNYDGAIPHAPSSITDYDAGVGAYSAKDLDSDNRNRTIEFFLVKEWVTALNNINWSVDFGDGNTVDSNITVNVSSPVMVLVQGNYLAGGTYDMNISTSNATTAFDGNIYEDKFGISIKSLSLASNDKTETVIDLVIENDINETASNVNWECDNGNKSSSALTIASNSNETISIAYNYSLPGEKKLTCNVSSDEGADNKTASFEIKGLEIQNVTITDISTATQRVRFDVYNHYYPLTVTWVVNSDGQTFSNSVALGTNESSAVTQDITYTTDGSKKVNISVYSGSIRDNEEYEIEINAFDIDRYERIDYNTTKKIISFIITNEWPSNLSTSWNLTDPSIVNSTYLNQNDTLMVLIETNYTTEGKKEPDVNVYSSSFLSTLSDWFNIYIVEALDLQTLAEGVTSTINEIIARSNSGNKTVSWSLDTGEEIINSTIALAINESNRAIILIEHNYTSSGVYKTNASINSSANQDHAMGVAIT